MAFPPHLPAPSCSIESHRKWQRIKILLLATFFGLAAGLSGAAIMLGWIWPGWGGGDDWVISRVNNSWLNRTQVEERVRLEMADRVAVVYERASVSRGVGYLDKDDRLGEAAIVTSDGWLVMYHPDSIASYKMWQVVLGGEVYKVDSILSDKHTDLVYFKLLENKKVAGREGMQFKVISFENNLSRVGDEVYVLQNDNWQYAVVRQVLSRATAIPHIDSAPITRYSVNIDINPGELVIDKSGKTIGVATEGSVILPARYISRVLAGVLEKRAVVYPSFGLEGWFNSEQPIIVGTESVKGFFVSKGAEEIRGGDIILEMNGQVVDEDVLWYNINNTSAVRTKLKRADKVLEIELNKN